MRNCRLDHIGWKVFESDARHPLGDLAGKRHDHSPRAKRRSDHASTAASDQESAHRQQARGERSGLVRQPSHHVRPDESTRRADGIDEGQSCRRHTGEESRRNRPEDRARPLMPVMARAIAATDTQKFPENRIAPGIHTPRAHTRGPGSRPCWPHGQHGGPTGSCRSPRRRSRRCSQIRSRCP